MRTPRNKSHFVFGITYCAITVLQLVDPVDSRSSNLLRQLNLEAQPKVVKIFGVGGVRQLEAYQSGILISPEGHILTTQSLVLDDGEVTVVLWNGVRAMGTVVSVDPLMELALIKIDFEEPLDYFDLAEQVEVKPGIRILALANVFGIAVYDEPISMLQGVVTSMAPLSARRGAFASNYSGTVIIVDAATNNPGAAGGAVLDFSGRLIGLIGKEMRSEATGTWLNFAIPVEVLREPIERMKKGEASPSPSRLEFTEDSASLAEYGIVLAPNVLERTPPYVDRIVTESLAEKAGLRPDDLIVGVGEQTVSSQRDILTYISRSDPRQPLQLTLLRGQELLRISIDPLGIEADRDE